MICSNVGQKPAPNSDIFHHHLQLVYTGHLIGCDKKSEICNIFQIDCARRSDYYAINYLIYSRLIYIVLPGFKGEKPL